MIDEVLKDLKCLSLKGPIKSIGEGSNAIGRTLQTELNIEHSTTSKNIYKGFIITSTTTKGARTNLFASVPNWQKSAIKSSKDMLNLYGVKDSSGKYEKKLFCSVDSLEPNNFGLFLDVDISSKLLYEKFSLKDKRKTIAIWDTERLKKKLAPLDKTIIISANLFEREDGKYYHFRFAEFLLGPSLDQFLNLINYGSISMDHLISIKKGSNKVREQGPLFKIAKAARQDLFFEYKKFDLMDA